MHQAHTIPWNMLASHFVFIRDNPHQTPRTTDIFPIHPPRPTRAGDLMHFTRVLAETIRSFARTEREKHPSAEELRLQVTSGTSDSNTNSTNIVSMNTKETSTDSSSPSSSTIPPPKLFPDLLLTRYPNYLTTKMQNPVYWAERAWRNAFDGRPSYSTSHGDLADAVKVLMYATDARAVLCLVHLPFEKGAQNAPGSNPHVPASEPWPPLVTLSNLGWGHSFGFNRIVDNALWVYIYLNLSATFDLVSSGTFMETCNFAGMFRETTQEMDYCAQQLPHRAFWERMGIDGTDPSIRLNPKFCSRFNMYVPKSRPWTGSDLEWMERYLKEILRLLYVYDMVMRECGMEVQWENEIVFTVRRITRAGINIGRGVVEFT